MLWFSKRNFLEVMKGNYIKFIVIFKQYLKTNVNDNIEVNRPLNKK